MPFVESSSARLRYELTDLIPPWTRPDTVLFHHGVATSLEIWSEWLPALVDRHALLRFDMRGCGHSSHVPVSFEWSVDHLLDDIIRVADAADVERFHFVGESFGGTLGIALAAREPERMLSLTLANAAPRGGLVKNLSGWRGLMSQSPKVWSDQMMEWRFAPDELDAPRREWFQGVQERSDSDVTLAIADLLARTDLSETLAEIRMPTLLLAPGESPFIPAEVMRNMHLQIPGSQFRMFEGVRHGLPFSRGPECGAILASFLADQTTPRQ